MQQYRGKSADDRAEEVSRLLFRAIVRLIAPPSAHSSAAVRAPATLAGLVSGDTNANLTDAINGEQHEADMMYLEYARQADQAGNPQTVSLFREIASDENVQQQAFEKARTAA